MSTTSTPMRALAGLGLSLTLVASQAPSATPAAAAGGHANVEVVDLRVDGRHDEPLGIDNANPLLSWQMVETRRAAAHRCHRPAPGRRVRATGRPPTRSRPPAARPSLQQRPAALGLRQGRTPTSSPASATPGAPLASREQVVWRVRVWDADRRAVGLERPVVVGDGPARAGRLGRGALDRVSRAAPRTSRCRSSPASSPSTTAGKVSRRPALPVRRRAAPADGQRPAADRRGARARQLELPAVQRVPDLRRHRRRCARAPTRSASRLGNGPAYVRRSVTNPAVGRTAPYSWWQSQLKGSGVLAADAEAGATTVTAGQRRRLPRRRHHQRRHRRRRRQPRIPHHHGDRHRRRRRHGHHVHPGTGQAAHWPAPRSPGPATTSPPATPAPARP